MDLEQSFITSERPAAKAEEEPYQLDFPRSFFKGIDLILDT